MVSEDLKVLEDMVNLLIKSEMKGNSATAGGAIYASQSSKIVFESVWIERSVGLTF